MGKPPPRASSDNVRLRDVRHEDLAAFYQHQLDKDANVMAAFTAKDPEDRGAFMSHWEHLLGDAAITKQTILVNEQVAGHVASFARDGDPEVTYWLGREYWGMGVATRALAEFLEQIETRPLFASVAQDNLPSIRVLIKCGFALIGEDTAFSNARNEEVAEFILRLDGV